MTMCGNQKAMICQRGDTDGFGIGRVPAHHRAAHIGAVGKVERHAADPSAVGRVAAHTVVTTAGMIGR